MAVSAKTYYHIAAFKSWGNDCIYVNTMWFSFSLDFASRRRLNSGITMEVNWYRLYGLVCMQLVRKHFSFSIYSFRLCMSWQVCSTKLQYKLFSMNKQMCSVQNFIPQCKMLDLTFCFQLNDWTRSNYFSKSFSWLVIWLKSLKLRHFNTKCNLKRFNAKQVFFFISKMITKHL